MARQLSLVSATLITAAVSGLLPMASDHIGSAPPPPPTITPSPGLPSTVPTSTAPTSVAAVALASNGSVPANTSLEVPQGGITILNLDASTRLAFRAQDEARDRTQTAHPLFRNTTDTRKTVTLTLFAQDRTGQEVKCVKLDGSSFFVREHSAAFQQLSIRNCDKASGRGLAYPLGGFVRFTVTPAEKVESDAGKDAKALPRVSEPGVAFVPFSISDPPASDCAATLTFLIPLALAAVVVLITTVRLKKQNIDLKDRMGNSTWSFGQSWGANVAIAGALLGAIFTATIFPDHAHFMSKNSYAMLQALFAAIIALAPLVYALIRDDVVANLNGVVSTNSQGYVIMFLIAGGLVLWAAIGQVTTLA